MKIQKYKWMKNMPKFNKYVKLLKEKYSVCNAARTLKMNYSQLHSLLSCKKTTWPSSVTMYKEKCDKLLLRQSQQLSYKRYEKLHFLRTSLAMAYEMYAKEEMKLGFMVLSQSSVYRYLKGRFRVRKINAIQRHSMCRLSKQ